MNRFSDRIGATASPLQIDILSEELRTALWNALVVYVLPFGYGYDGWKPRAVQLYSGLSFPIDEACEESHYADVARMKRWFFARERKWFEPYNFVDYCVRHREHICPNLDQASEFVPRLNAVLEEHNSGYRVLNGVLIPITNETELQAVHDAATLPGDRLAGVREHISTAVTFSQRPEPDYRNSIKESISALEGLAQVLAGKDGATLPDALKLLEKVSPMHPALRSALEKLYAYTSDADGIRHALSDEGSSASFDDAKFMLVLCSALVNYLAPRAARS
jgi:hypothetical protein